MASTDISSSTFRATSSNNARTEAQPEVRTAAADEDRSQPRVDEGERFEYSSAYEDEDEDNGAPSTLAAALREEQPGTSTRSSFKNPPGVKSELEGYDQAKLNDPNVRTPKYLFGRVAQNYSLDSLRTKEDGTKLLNEMLPDLRAAGLDVISVDRDILKYRNPETGNVEEIDVIRALGGNRSSKGETPGWQWSPVTINGVPVDGQQGAQQAGGAVPPPPNVPMTAELQELGQKFMAVAQKYPLADVEKDKKGVEGRLNEMTGDLKANGVNVASCCKDVIVVQLKDGQFQCIDVVQGAGAAGASWQWMPSSLPMPFAPQL
ncbi:MAG: hypothetical protein FJX76_04585 [Armatimonadetes bacterium]|nr:hypothetical protein [Armatimonadota bacterium]